MELTSSIAFDLAKLLTLDRPESLGVFADASISIPLLRGAGRHIAAEPLTQAERNVIYAIYEFERYKGVFAVQIAGEYLGVLRQLNQYQNAEENYRGLIASARRARRLADSGRLPEIQFDQAVQDELRARDRWIQARQSTSTPRIPSSYPWTAPRRPAGTGTGGNGETSGRRGRNLDGRHRNGAIPECPSRRCGDRTAASRTGCAGMMAMEESRALQLALDHRFDLRVAQGQVYDAQRQVTLAADALRAELTLLGSAQAGGSGRSRARSSPTQG